MTLHGRHILLLNLRDYSFHEGLRTEYLAFGYLTAALRARGHKVTWLDENTDGPYSPETFDFNLYMPVDIVGMSPSFATYRRALDWLTKWKSEYYEIVTILGGQHAMMVPDQILLESNVVDYVCLGEGEDAICALADAMEKKAPRSDIPGLAFRRREEIIRGDCLDPPKPLADLPWPARDSLEKWIARKQVSQVSVQNSRGCQYGCSFCHFPEIRKRRYGYDGRFRSSDDVVRELIYLCDSYGVREFFFNSPQFGGRFAQGKQWMSDFADRLISCRRDIRFEIECRSDTLDDKSMIEKLAKAGLIRVFLGLESANSETLRSFRKGISTDTHKRVISYLSDHDIAISGSGFIMLHPLTTLEQLRENAEFLRDIGDTHIHTLWSRFRLFPGIAQSKELERLGLADPNRRHDEVMKYRFRDTRTALLAESAPRALNSTLLGRANRLVRLVDIEIGLETANLPAIVTNHSEQAVRDLLEIRESSRGLRNAILTAFFDHFLYCLRIAVIDGHGDGWVPAAERLHRHLSALGPRINSVLGQHDSILMGLMKGKTRRSYIRLRNVI